MALERDFIVHDTHSRTITALGCSPTRREVYLGFEDGVVKSIEVDTKNHVQTYWEHKGWITAFLYWPVTKTLFCSSNDAVVSAVGAGGLIVDKVYIGQPIYSMAFNNRRKEIIFGVANGLQFHQLFETKESFSHYIDSKPSSIVREHTDIVRCVVVLESRIYSGGYDGALVIYDCHFAGQDSAIKYFKNARAHEAGISCMSVEKDVIENTVWVFTGSFDKTLKVWTGDGKIVHKFDGFITGVTGLSYIPKNKTVCCAAGANTAFIYDPKSGEDVTNYIDTFNEDADGNHYLHLLKYLSDFSLLLATTSRKQLIVYKYNPNGCLTSLKFRKALDSICYTSKIPILIFSGDASGSVYKWEQRQSNQLIYDSEHLLKSEMVMRESSRMQGQAKQNSILTNSTTNLKNANTHSNSNSNSHSKNNSASGSRIDKDVLSSSLSSAQITTIASGNNSSGGGSGSGSSISANTTTTKNNLTARKTNVVLKLVFVESLDLILAACEDACIYVWGFDEEAVKILKNMKYSDDLKSEEFDYNIFFKSSMASMNLNEDGEYVSEDDETQNKKDENDSVTNRVAGFKLRIVLAEHTSCVTSLSVIERLDIYPSRYLISAGWDRRICIWDLDKLKLFDIFRNKSANNFDEVELASDGNILDMCYCDKFDYFAYACTDSMCYIRKFSIIGSEMSLVNTLQGHSGEVNCIRWTTAKSNWITGGEDGTVRFWSENCECIQVINCGATVNSICIDLSQDALMVACHDIIKVYEMEDYHLVQTNIGHHDSIRDIIFIPERSHIVSVSWDRTIKVWRSYRKTNFERKKVEKDKDKKFETWVWEQMKMAMKSQTQIAISNYPSK